MIERVRVTGGKILTLPALAWHQWHGAPTKHRGWRYERRRGAMTYNRLRFRRMRRKMRRMPGLAVRNSGRWGLLDKLGPLDARAKLRPKMSRQERRNRRRKRRS
jgi:hypothetical protein